MIGVVLGILYMIYVKLQKILTYSDEIYIVHWVEIFKVATEWVTNFSYLITRIDFYEYIVINWARRLP
jgi:hypothetical protein